MKGITLVKWITILALLLTALPQARAEDTFRCRPEIVSVGDTAGKVAMKCGEPTWREPVGYRNGWMENQLWYYNCGSSDYLYVLQFVGGRLKNVESQGYGKGESDCYRPRSH
jgi:hypothetical protein